MPVLSLPTRRPAPARLARLFRAWFIAVALLISAAISSPAQTASPKEYQIKAAFLFNFAQFIEWPPGAFAKSDAPFCVGILGDDPFGSALEQTIQGENIHNRKLIIQRSLRTEDLKDCQLVFICRSEKGRLDQILSLFNSREVLTVSEVDGFARRGGVINFYLEGKKVRFEINPAAAQRGHLKISSQLLSLGKIVDSLPVKDHE